ncbi:ribonuclease activity regulator protein RraA [Vibrio cyclitrophicus]
MLLYVIKINPLFSLLYVQSNNNKKLIEHIYLLDSKDSFQLPWFIFLPLAGEM